MLTRCPHCTTTFRVKPEQLKARLGRVRCGQCQTVFNALDSLVEEAPATPITPQPLNLPEEPLAAPPVAESEGEAVGTVPVTEAVEAPAEADEVEAASSLAANDAHAQAMAPTEAAPEPVEVEESIPEAPTAPTPEPKPAIQVAEPPLAAATDQDDEPVAAEAPAAEPEPKLKTEPAAPSQVQPESEPESEPEPRGDDTAPAADLDFTPVTATEEAPAEAPPSEPADGEAPAVAGPAIPTAAHEPLLHQPVRAPRRWPWAVLAVLAFFLLIGQALFYFRVEVAVFAPALKPLLKAACEPLGCQVPRPRKADLLDIESSDLHPGKTKGRLELSAVLKNKAPFAQELPVLELSLTDVADRALIVKALQPADYLPMGRKPGDGFPAKGEINVNLVLDAGDTPASGYRLYLYYP